MAIRFDGKVAIVSGAGSGLGRAYAHMLAERGASVLVNDLGGSTGGRGSSKESADKVVAEIRAKGGRAVANYDNVTDGDKIVKHCMQEFGRVDIIINNAGIARAKPFERFTEEDFDVVYATHVWGSYKIVKAAWPIMEAQKYGRIINISSPTAIYGMAPANSYCTAKAALLGFTLTLAREGVKYNIKVNNLAPNATTRLARDPTPLFGIDTGPYMDPTESIAPVATFLAHESCPKTGHFFECGAGWVARVRIQRTKGVEFRPDASFTPASIREKFQEISDFSKDAVVPEEVQVGPGSGEDTMTRLARVTALPPTPKTEELSFKDRVVVITGAGAGLGRAYALMFAKAGAKVVVNDLGGGRFGEDEKEAVRPADVVVEEIRKLGGTAVANYSSVVNGGEVIETAIRAFGRVDIVINNAGILRDKSFKRMSDTDWTLIQDVHVKGPFAVARAAWPYFIKQRFGRLINTTSSVGLYGNFGQANYSTAKMSMIGFSNELAIEGAKYNITVNTLAPGAGTRLTATVMTPDVVEAMKPDFVAPLVGYLVHPDTWVTSRIFESASGWNAEVRWQRTGGYVFPLPHTAEDIRDHWKEVNDFKDGRVEYPTSLSSTVEAMRKAAYFQKGIAFAKSAKL